MSKHIKWDSEKTVFNINPGGAATFYILSILPIVKGLEYNKIKDKKAEHSPINSQRTHEVEAK